MYSVVLLTALTAGGEVGGVGRADCGGWWYAPIPYVDVIYPAPIQYAPSPAAFAPGGVIGPSLAQALAWIVPAGKPLTDAEKKAWADYFKDLTPDEQAEVAAVWRSADFDGQRKLIAQVEAMRPKEEKKKDD